MKKGGRRRSEAGVSWGWTNLIDAPCPSALARWLLLRRLPLFGTGAGGMSYLAVTDLVPQAQERQYRQVPAIAMGIGFMIVFALSAYL